MGDHLFVYQPIHTAFQVSSGQAIQDAEKRSAENFPPSPTAWICMDLDQWL
jgi:hypothetical protein